MRFSTSIIYLILQDTTREAYPYWRCSEVMIISKTNNFLNESWYVCEKRGGQVHKSNEKCDIFEVILASDAEMKTFFIDDEHSAALLSKGKHLNRSGIANR